jgi:REP element-mobilizing transposase RayT
MRTPQLALTWRTWGGARAGAGRKRHPRAHVRHAKRERFAPRCPVHVTLRVNADSRGLRCRAAHAAIRASIRNACRKSAIRICEYSIQDNHLHLICEAAGADSLARGMQGFTSSVARRLNRLRGRRGRVFADRYHAHVLRTPREVRHALTYVLSNWRRHRADTNHGSWPVDPYSSALWFDGWGGSPTAAIRNLPEWRALEPPHAHATGWLLTTGWRRDGLLCAHDVPGRHARR